MSASVPTRLYASEAMPYLFPSRSSERRDDTALRHDARLRRERLIQAAVELYATDGVDVPLEKVAERAAVGRGTLYRNFANREALSAAVVQARVDALAAFVAELGDRDDAFLVGIRALAGMVYAGGFEKMRAIELGCSSIPDRFRLGVEALLAEPLARAQAAGLVRRDFAVSDALTAALMIAGGGLISRGQAPAHHLDRALDMLTAGLRPHASAPGDPAS